MSTDPALISKILLKKLREEALTSQEADTLAEWQGRSPAHAAFIDNMMDETQLDLKIKNLLEQDEDAGWEKIERKIAKQEGVFVAKRSTGWYKYAVAASLVVLTGLAVYYFVFQVSALDPPKNNIPTSLANFSPGTTRAQLILADRSVFELDTVHNGKFTHQFGVDIIKKDSGTVSYETQGQTIETAPSVNKLITPRGGEFRLVLPDGTVAYLNAASSIEFPAVFPRHERKVEITGEVYFEVAPATQKPFRVVVKTSSGAQKQEVEALGTRFNIKAYDEEKTVATTLVEGKVRLAPYSSAGTSMLSPGQQANLAPGNVLDIVNDVDTGNVLAWKNKMFSFNSSDIQTVMREVSRWYGIDVVFEGPIGRDKLNGQAPRSISLEQLLAVISAANAKFSFENGKLMVRSARSF